MNNFEDLTGTRVGRLTILGKGPTNKYRHSTWKCKCDCGNIILVTTTCLKNKSTKSCGCLQRDLLIERNMKHNLSNTRLHDIWSGIKLRCYNKNTKAFKDYGGRGITMCDEWTDKEKGFINFYNWAIQNSYKDDLSIDRINVNGNYEPKNCRWCTPKEQSNNRRNNHSVKYNNEIRNIAEWGEIYNINRGTICSRLKSGWSIERALTTPARKKAGKNVLSN